MTVPFSDDSIALEVDPSSESLASDEDVTPVSISRDGGFILRLCFQVRSGVSKMTPISSSVKPRVSTMKKYTNTSYETIVLD